MQTTAATSFASSTEEYAGAMGFGIHHPEQVVTYFFPKGLLQFPDHQNWVVITDNRSPHFEYLQSLTDDQQGSFIIAQEKCFPNYSLNFTKTSLTNLEHTSEQDPTHYNIYFMVQTAHRMHQMQVDLQYPILVHPRTFQGVQLEHQDAQLQNKKDLLELIRQQQLSTSMGLA